jgi:4'-phosphopantetheinyl transferase
MSKTQAPESGARDDDLGPRILELEPSIHVLTRKLSDVPAGDDWLAPGECAVASRMRFQKRRDDWRLGRWTAKQALAARLGLSQTRMPALEIRAADDGAPEPFLDGHPVTLSLSISHSAGVSMCAVGPEGSQVGCDLEYILPVVENFVDDYFVPEEASLLQNVAPGERTAIALLIWSAKESALKSLRQGLRRDTRSVVVSLDPKPIPGIWRPLSVQCRESSRLFPGWWRVSPAYVRTVTYALPAPVQIRTRLR